MNKVYLSLGTNMGDRLDNLLKGCMYLSQDKNISITKKSKIYETKAWGYKNQDDFLNICLEIETSLDEYTLLDYCLEVEQKLHRERIIRWGPRTLDIDILFFNDIKIDSEHLYIPHPRIKERAFVLIPLLELNDNLTIEGINLAYHLNKLSDEDKKEVIEFNNNN